jgi:hypothetical protein
MIADAVMVADVVADGTASDAQDATTVASADGALPEAQMALDDGGSE